MSCPGNLLFVTPKLPCRQGSPVAIRAYNTLTELLSNHRGFLLVTQACDNEAALDPDLAANLAGYEIYHRPQVERRFTPPRFVSQRPWLETFRARKHNKLRAQFAARTADQGACAFPGTTFERMHALGLSASFAVQARLELPSTRALQPRISLDLEPEQLPLAPTEPSSVAATHGNGACAQPFGHFHELWVDTRSKLRRLRHQGYAGQILMVPVRVPVVDDPRPPRPHSGSFRWLTVGANSTDADLDDLRRLYQALRPVLHSNAEAGGRLHIVDHDGHDRLARALRVATDLRLHPPRASVEAAYRAADACLVTPPANRGGVLGILQAFAHQRPVIALRQATLGLKIEHARELLIAEDFEELAQLAQQLVADPTLRARLAMAGRNYQVRFHLAEGTRIHHRLPYPLSGRSSADHC